MSYLKRFMWGMLLLSLFISTSCTGINQKKFFQLPKEPVEFVTAVRLLSNSLLRTIENYQIEHGQLKEGKFSKTRIILKPFINVDTGEQVKFTQTDSQKTLEDMILQEVRESQTCVEETCQDRLCKSQELIVFPEQSCQERPTQKRFSAFSIQLMNEETLSQADYIIYGMIRLEPSSSVHKHYQLYASVVDRDTKKVLGVVEVGIKEDPLTLVVKPLTIYQESPLYLKDSRLEYLVYLTLAKPGTEVKLQDTVEAILIDAAYSYEKQDYEKAKFLYNKATESPDGNGMETYLGLYLTYLKQKQMEKAKEAFAKAITIGMGTLNLKTKFPFKTNSTEFDLTQLSQKAEEQNHQYPIWLYQLGEYFHMNNKSCFKIVGHSSKQGSILHRQELSLKRAKKIQSLILEHFPDLRMRIEGKGFEECIICSGTENERDRIDQRIEFKMVDDYECQLTSLSNKNPREPQSP